MRGISFLQCCRILSVCALLLSFTSCEQDEDVVFGRLVRYTWVGDLGFSDPWGEPLESGLYFDSDGFGQDEQCYYGSGRVAAVERFRWMLQGNTLSLDYGNQYPLIEISHLYVGMDELTGDLFVSGRFVGSVILYRY